MRWRLVARLHRAFEARRQELLAARVERTQAARCRRTPRLPAADEERPRRRLDDRADPGRPAVPPRRDHRAGRAQDDHQCAELRGRLVHDGLRGQQRAELGQPGHRPGQPDRRDPPHDRAGAGRQDLQAERQGRHAGGAPARLAPRREARAGRRPARLRRHLRLRALHVPQREGTARARQRPVLLPAEDGVAPRGAPLERHLRDDAEGTRHPAGHGQGHGADRDHPRRVRDGRDPVRAARALRRAERRPLGLHLLVHQEVQGRRELLPRRSREGHDDGALHARLCAAAAEDLPQAQRAGDRRHERADPDQERSGEERAGARRRALRQGARRHRRLRRRLGRAPGPGADRDGGVRQGARRPAATRSTRSATTSTSAAPTC